MNQHELLYNMFLTTLTRMDEKELKESLDKAKTVLNDKDYEKLLEFIEKEKRKKNP